MGSKSAGPLLFFDMCYHCTNQQHRLTGSIFLTGPYGRENYATHKYYKGKVGTHFILDATHLSLIGDNTYDFLISSNCLEHIANPLKALDEWRRVVKHNGYMVVLVPNKEHTFDHARLTTTFDHILSDYINHTAEDYLTHLDEILAHHDLAMDPFAGNYDAFRLRSLDNFNNRCLHHHVFDMPLLRELIQFVGIRVVRSDLISGNFAIMGENVK
jgi:ubiquinone/menaquinone biosynthesis C-methylase UbiE